MDLLMEDGFNPDPTEQTSEVYFSIKTKKDDFQLLILNASNIENCSSQKTLNFFWMKN